MLRFAHFHPKKHTERQGRWGETGRGRKRTRRARQSRFLALQSSQALLPLPAARVGGPAKERVWLQLDLLDGLQIGEDGIRLLGTHLRMEMQ